ncbi:hypothetical protein G4B88_004597 [Cannabis sativa]|uniref:Uncharacterized protein n=1 Tax=Cannabis sativa TaxID=3483 RepID=A0A7J6G7C1_CANSA|nr:hypothetical protein G4B88_004597 [Cannabis sativa]
MASSDKDLEVQLLESGNRLVEPPSSVDELLPLLDRVENCLSKVEQSPSESMQSALSPSLKALVDETLLGHTNVDVKVLVASCISEITRITAPDAPYDDDQMKEVFRLIVSSFENLSCVVMLDLECDALILEMFQHFLKAISIKLLAFLFVAKCSRPPPNSAGSSVCRSSPASFGFGGIKGDDGVAIRLQPRNAEELAADADFADCAELQSELKRLKLRKNN